MLFSYVIIVTVGIATKWTIEDIINNREGALVRLCNIGALICEVLILALSIVSLFMD